MLRAAEVDIRPSRSALPTWAQRVTTSLTLPQLTWISRRRSRRGGLLLYYPLRSLSRTWSSVTLEGRCLRSQCNAQASPYFKHYQPLDSLIPKWFADFKPDDPQTVQTFDKQHKYTESVTLMHEFRATNENFTTGED